MNTDTHSVFANNDYIDETNVIDEDLQKPPARNKRVEIDTQKLKRDASERAKKQPILQRISKKISNNTTPFREIIINIEPLEIRVAQLADGILEKFEIERIGEERIVNSIFKGKIQNLESGLKAAFVDIGMQKNSFLHYWDILPAVNETATKEPIEVVRDTRKRKTGHLPKVTLKEIPELYPIGSDIVVQVVKGQIGTKGPRVTTSISVPGRYLVLTPFNSQCGVSRKIEDSKERRRLKKILNELPIPEGVGVIIRTAGQGKKMRYFIRDFELLVKTWKKMKARIDNEDAPCTLYREPDLIERAIRDFLTEDIDRVLVDDASAFERMREIIGQISTRSRSKITLFNETIPIFERFNIEKQVEQTYQRTVPLPSGGEVIIEETEALIAIDVNTGSHRQKGADRDNFILQVNREAAREIARQIRLRNIGGLIILDFIDMKHRRDRGTILQIMRREMAKDKARCQILPVSPLGIMQMTRQRHEESRSSGLYTGCHYCRGRGIVKSPRTMSVEIQRRLSSVVRRLRSHKENAEKLLHLEILCHPATLQRFETEDKALMNDLEKLYNIRLSYRSNSTCHVENFKIYDTDRNEMLR